MLRGGYTQAKEKRNPKARLPISIDLLHKLKRVWEMKASEDAIMLWAAASCFFGFLRSGEIMVPKALERWRSNAYQLYIKTSQEHLGHVSQLLAGSKNRN